MGPDLTIFDGTFAPAPSARICEQIARGRSQACATVVVLAADSPFSEAEYRQAGVPDCLVGPENLARLHDIAAAARRGGPPAGRKPGLEARTSTSWTRPPPRSPWPAAARRSPRRLQMIKLVAASQCNPVLVAGDTGTGKEIAARAVHTLRHPGQPFVAVNCAALTANLLESELFGHVKGSFTGADRDKTGLLEMAGAGTIFLDEISEMPLDLQAKLLRILQEKTFRKVGGIQGPRLQGHDHRLQQPRPEEGSSRETVPPGPVLSSEHLPDPAGAAGGPRSDARTSPCWPPIS